VILGRRIIYVLAQFKEPFGGLRASFRHVETLARHGFNAWAFVLARDPDGILPPPACPVIYGDDAPPFYDNDILVFPESWVDLLPRFGGRSSRFVIFCQNNFLVYRGLPDGGTYEDHGVKRILCSSDTIRDFLCREYGYRDLPVVHYGIDPETFRPLEKRLQIAFMPRKMPLEASYVIGLFRRRFPEHADVTAVAIERRTETETAQILGESAVFLSLSSLEGFGLPPVEAMAAGAVVVGFHGDGGREYASPENGLWVETGDLDGCVSCLATAVHGLKTGDARIRRLLGGGQRTAERYRPERERRELLDFWTREISC
jgi:glycosyltransferase involved in cell wall biosynthesis